MPHLYLAQFIGNGTEKNPFEVRGISQDGASILDLRPDSTQPSGYAIIGLPMRQDEPGSLYLGNDLLGRSAAAKNTIASRLGLTLDTDTLRQILPELMLVHARGDGTRWKPLLSTRYQWEIWLGNECVWKMPIVAGGVTASDNFNRVDENPLSGGGVWVGGAGGYRSKVISNKVGVGTHGELNIDRYTGTAFSANQFSQITVDPVPSSLYAGLSCRTHATAYTMYIWRVDAAAGNHTLRKYVGGTLTTLATWASAPAVGVVRLTVDGSSLTGYQAGTSRATATDTAITAADAPGLNAATDTYRGDDWSGGDLSATFNEAVTLATSGAFSSVPENVVSQTATFGASAAHSPIAGLVFNEAITHGTTASTAQTSTLDLFETLTLNATSAYSASFYMDEMLPHLEYILTGTWRRWI